MDLRFLPDNGARYELAVEVSGSGLKTTKTETYSISTNWLLDIRKDSNDAYIKATYKRIKADLAFPSDSLQVDSDHPVPDSLAMSNPRKYNIPWIWQGIKGQSFTYRMNSLGQIDSMQPFTSLMIGLVENVLHGPIPSGDHQLRDQVWNTASAQFNEKAVHDQLMLLFPEYPGRQLKVGDTLGRTYQNATGLPLVMVQVFKVSEITDSEVTLLLGGSGFLEQTEISLKAEQQGKIVVNRNTGMMESVYIEEILNGTMEKLPFKQSTTMKASCKKLGQDPSK
ncbi:MAG: hypothetical protein J7578_19920 [Chitinophagaceae bacterium]|nr:hypothetical protein [Chitinophagaceae bacterium]